MNTTDIREWVANKISPRAKASLPKLTNADMGIITQLAQEFKDRTRKDLQNWKAAKQALDTAETPRWALLQDLYDGLRPDAHFGSQVLLRIAAVRCTPYVVRDRKSNTVNIDKTDLLKTDWFFNLLGDLMEAVFFKTTLVQFPNYKAGDMNYTKLPRRNVVPEKRLLLKEVFGDIAFSIDDPIWADSMVYAVHQSDYGLMDYIVKDLVWKKNSRESWAEFSEKFGIPLVSATTSTRDKKEIARIQAMLKALGEAATAVLPTGSQITIHDSAAKGDPYKVYLEAVNMCNQEISKLIVGGTMISDSGSSYNQSKTHEKGFGMITEEDKKFIEFIVNKQILPKLPGWSESDEFAFDRTEQLSLKDLWGIVQGMLQEGAEIEPKWVAEKFNIPVTKFNPKAVAATANFKQAPTAMAIAVGASGIVWPNYTACCIHPPLGDGGLPVAAWQDIPGLKELGEQLLKALYEGKPTTEYQLLRAILTAKQLTAGLFDGWGSRRLQIDYNATDNRALAAMEFNLFHFSATKEKAGVLALNQLLIDSYKNEIRQFNDFRDQALPLLKDMDVNNLRTEFNMAVATGQNASRYQQFMSEKDTVTSFVQYQTVGDDHVRPAHQALDGRIFSLDDATARRVWPPNSWNCRCEFIQYLGDAKGKTTSGAEAEKIINWSDKDKKTFGLNRGEIGQVFTANQMYVKDTGLAADIASMTYDTYGLQPLKKAQAGKKKITVDTSITKDNVTELFKPASGETFMGFKDYLQRNIVLKQDVFKQHTKGKYVTAKERRHQLVPHIADVLKQPDEVWFNEFNGRTLNATYVKHYSNTSLSVTTSLGKQNLEIQTWFELEGDDKRRGLLIRKK